MPAYPWLLTNTLDFARIQSRVDAMAMLGVPYGDAVGQAPEMARAQARGHRRDIAGRRAGRPGWRTRRSWRWSPTCSGWARDISAARRRACPTGGGQ